MASTTKNIQKNSSQGSRFKRMTQKVNKVSKRLIHGRMLSTDFFSRHWITITLVVLMFVWYTTNKYECQTRMETIKSLEKELEIVRTERVKAQSEYMSRIRETAMHDLVQRHGLNLYVQEEPPYRLQLEKEPQL